MTPNYVPCPYCEPGEPGWIVVNPDWPNGTLHYRESCPWCSGDGRIHRDSLPSADEMTAWLIDFLEATR